MTCMTNFRDLDLVWLDTESFAAAVHAKGAPLRQCFGFIDGTVRPIARPTVNQRIMYSGHKRVHCLKFQVCTCVYLCNHDCLTLFFNHLTVCCHTQWFSSAHVRTNWRQETWCLYAFCKWVTKQIEITGAAKWSTLCAIWRSRIWSN